VPEFQTGLSDVLVSAKGKDIPVLG